MMSQTLRPAINSLPAYLWFKITLFHDASSSSYARFVGDFTNPVAGIMFSGMRRNDPDLLTTFQRSTQVEEAELHRLLVELAQRAINTPVGMGRAAEEHLAGTFRLRVAIEQKSGSDQSILEESVHPSEEHTIAPTPAFDLDDLDEFWATGRLGMVRA